MAPIDYRCAMCGGAPRDDGRFDCVVCERPFGICADCGWCVRFFESDNPKDCDGCGYAPMTPEEEERTRPERERLVAAMSRVIQAVTQMQARSGPYYELAHERSRIISEAYRAARKPRKVSMVLGCHPRAYVFHVRRGDTYHQEPATQADADAWYAWWRERDRLRRELGMSRGQGRPVAGRDAPDNDCEAHSGLGPSRDRQR
jgi:hypothetical protein